MEYNISSIIANYSLLRQLSYYVKKENIDYILNTTLEPFYSKSAICTHNNNLLKTTVIIRIYIFLEYFKISFIG